MKLSGISRYTNLPAIAMAAVLIFFVVPESFAESGEDAFSDVPVNAYDGSDPYVGSGAPEVEDRFESFNRAMFSFNDKADRYVLKPVAEAYQFVTPDIVDQGVTNFFNNLGDVDTFINSLLQGKFHNATVTLNRIIYNTVFGLGGLIDVSTSFGLHNDEEDFGQTLAVWGYEESSYLMLPFLGPSTVRDFGGFVVDQMLYDPLDEIGHLEDEERMALKLLNVIDKRADLLAAENLMVGGDRYVFLRNAYMQNRQFLISDGEVEDSFADDDFEELEGF